MIVSKLPAYVVEIWQVIEEVKNEMRAEQLEIELLKFKNGKK